MLPTSIGRRVFVSTIWGRRKKQDTLHLHRKDPRGDKLELVNLEISAKLKREQRELFEQLAVTVNAAVKPTKKEFLDWQNEALEG